MTTDTVTGFRHTDLGEFTAEASDLGWPPGHWPGSFTARIGDVTYAVSAPVPTYDREGDLVKMRYFARGATFIIWND